MEVRGRKAKDFIVESIDDHIKVPLPPMLECDMITEDRSEIPSPEVAQYHPHLKALSHKIHAIDSNAQILLLLGRDILSLHKVREQCNGPHNAPFAQRLDLGWVIVGDVCLNGAHKPVCRNVQNKHIAQRTSIVPQSMSQCPANKRKIGKATRRHLNLHRYLPGNTNRQFWGHYLHQKGG